jgi:hypothetical protein
MNMYNVTERNDTIYQSLIQELLTCAYETTGEYLRLNNDLRKLSSNDRSIVLRNAANNICCMSGEFVMNYCHLLSLDTFSNAIRTLYGRCSVDLHRWALKFVDSDIIVFKLALSLIAFSENLNSFSFNNLMNPITTFEIQNKYVEIIWKYFLYKYGHYQSVQKFINLISWFLAITVVLSYAQNVTPHVNNVNSLVEQTELKLILDEVDQILETDYQ